MDLRATERQSQALHGLVNTPLAATPVRATARPLGRFAVLLLALSFTGAVQALVLSSEEEEIKEKQLAACKAITGQDIDSSSRCLAIIQERISGQAGFSLPEFSAVDHYLTAAKRLPPVGTLQRMARNLGWSEQNTEDA